MEPYGSPRTCDTLCTDEGQTRGQPTLTLLAINSTRHRKFAKRITHPAAALTIDHSPFVVIRD